MKALTEYTATVQEMKEILTSSRSDSSDSIIQELLALGGTMTPEEGDRFVDENPELLDLSPLASQHYCAYVLAAESDQAQKMLSATNDESFSFGTTAHGFGKQAYDRVGDIFERIDFGNCQRFAMVGCGALAVTMFQVLEHTNVPEIIGLDVRPEAISTFEAIVRKYRLERIKPLLADGQTFDFAGADIVYVANMVSPKRQVLERILETAKSTVQIIMRDPYSIGRLWTERGVDSLDRRVEVLGYGKPAPQYFSRDVYVRVVQGSPSRRR